MELFSSNIPLAFLSIGNAIDAVVVLVCLCGALIGVWTGFVWQIIRLVSWIVALWTAGQYHYALAQKIGFGLGDGIRRFLAFLAIVLAILLLFYLIAHLGRSIIDALNLTLADRIVGGCLGFLKGLLVCGVISLAVLQFLNTDSGLHRMVAESHLATKSAHGTAMIHLLLLDDEDTE